MNAASGQKNEVRQHWEFAYGPETTPTECLHYALNLTTSVVITGIDSTEILDQACEALRAFRPMSAEQVQSLLLKTAEVAEHGEFEPFKTTSIFDGTARNP